MPNKTKQQVRKLKTTINNAVASRFYKKKWFIVLALIFISPLGVFLWYKFRPNPKTKLRRITKRTVSIILVVFWCLMALGFFIAPLYNRTFEVNGQQLSISCSNMCSKVDEYGDVTALKTLATIGVEDISSMPDKRAGNEVNISDHLGYKDLTSQLTLVYTDSKLVKVYSTGYPIIIYYSTDSTDVIASYKNDRNKAVADAKAKDEAEKEAVAKAKADAKAKKESEQKAETDAKAKAKAEADAQSEANKKAEAETQAKAKQEAEAEAQAKANADAKAKADAEAKQKQEEADKAEQERIANLAPSEAGTMTLCEQYLNQQYPYGTTVHSILGVIANTLTSNDTRFYKVNVDIKNAFSATRSTVMECTVTKTGDYIKITSFYVY